MAKREHTRDKPQPSAKELVIQQIAPEEAPLVLLLDADPSEQKVQSYLSTSLCYVGLCDDHIVGVYVLQQKGHTCWELMNIAVDPASQQQGIGTALLHHAIATARTRGADRLEVGTGTFGYQLTFYQRAGFRAVEIDHDFFLRHYDEPLIEAGIQHKDMLRLALEW